MPPAIEGRRADQEPGVTTVVPPSWFGGTTTVEPAGGVTTVVRSVVPQAVTARAPRRASTIFDGIGAFSIK